MSASPSSADTLQLSSEVWAARIASHADLPDERLNTRLGAILATFAAKPSDSIPQANSCCSQAQAMYRFFANERFGFDDLLQPLVDTTVDLSRGLSGLLAVQDSSSLNYSGLKTTTGLGPLNDVATARGLHLHTTLAVRTDGVTVGLLGQSLWARSTTKRAKNEHHYLPIEEKESRKWLDGIEAAEAAWEGLPFDQRPRLIHVMDREGDIHEVLERITDSPHAGIIRCAQNRSVAGDLATAFETIAAAPLRGSIVITVPRAAYQPEPRVPQRQARLDIRAVALTLWPKRRKYPHRRPVTWNLLDVRENNPPLGSEPLQWYLWTNLPVDTMDELRKVLDCYGFRWRIEDYHLILKSGCQVEKLELETDARLCKAALLYSAVAARLLTLRDLARVHPEAPCTTILTKDEWHVLWLRFAKAELTKDTPPPTLQQIVRWIGQLGGHLGRKRDGLPGVRTLWRGFRDLTILVTGFRIGKKLS
jgi:hypothetical protein